MGVPGQLRSPYDPRRSQKSGRLVIVDNSGPEGAGQRRKHDGEQLRKLFGERFRFRIGDVVSDFKVEDIRRRLHKYADEDNSTYGCLVVAILTDGDRNGRLWAKDKVYNPSEISTPFAASASLKGKPKIFIYKVDGAGSALKMPPAIPDSLFVFVNEEDTRFHRQTLHQDYAGSIYVKNLVMELKNCSQDLVDVLTRVHYNFKSWEVEAGAPPYFVSLLQGPVTLGSNMIASISRQRLVQINSGKEKSPNLKHDTFHVSRFDVPGRALILNHFKFDDPTLTRREGTFADVSRLGETFESLGFQLEVCNDLSVQEMRAMLAKYSEGDYTTCGCLVVVVLTHGRGGSLHAKDGLYEVNELWDSFLACPSLENKPKIFFVQAKLGTAECELEMKLPSKTDFILSFASAPGFFYPKGTSSYRFLYTEALCGELLRTWKDGHASLLTALTAAAFQVQKQSSCGRNYQKPFFVSTATRRIVFSDLRQPAGHSSHLNADIPDSLEVATRFRCRRGLLPKIRWGRAPRTSRVPASVDSIGAPQGPDDSDEENTYSTYDGPSVRTEVGQMFGVLRNFSEIVDVEFKPLVERNDHGGFLRGLLRQHQHNVVFLTKHLLDLLYKHERIELAQVLLNFKLPPQRVDHKSREDRDLPQREVLHFLWRILTDNKSSLDMLRLWGLRKKFLHLHLDLSRPDQAGFPLLCLLKSSVNEEEIVEKFEYLISIGAVINERYEPFNEETPIHYAARTGMWKIVELLLKFGANIDIEINQTTARQIINENKRGDLIIISEEKTELENDSKITQANDSERDLVNQISEKKTEVEKQMFRALYDRYEVEFLRLATENRFDFNAIDGRYTLLQLAVVKMLPKVASELIKRGASFNKMAGLCVEPIVLCLNNPKFEVLEVFSAHISKIDLLLCQNGSTILHIIAEKFTSEVDFSSDDIVKTLVEKAISQFIHISAKNGDSKTALEIAATKSNPRMLNILLENGGFLTIHDELLLKLQPEQISDFLDTKYEFSDKETSNTLEVDYNFLKPIKSTEIIKEPQVPEMLPFFEISKSEKHKALLLHPLVLLFLVHKWRQVAFTYFINFFFHLLFTVTFTVYLNHVVNNFVDTPNSTVTQNKISEGNGPIKMMQEHTLRQIFIIVNKISFWILWLILLKREIFQMFLSFKNYIMNSVNYLEIFLLTFSALTFTLDITSQNRFIPALAIAFTYIDLTLLFGRHPYTETYVKMFRRVAMKTTKLLVLFASFIFAFAYAFRILFHDTNDQFFNKSLWASAIKTSIMSIGEIGYEGMEFRLGSELTGLMIVVFAILVSVVLMNLLNALAIIDTQQILNETKLLCCLSNIKHYAKIEQMLLNYSLKNPGERCYKIISEPRMKIFAGAIYLFKLFSSKFSDMTLSPFTKSKYKLYFNLNCNKNLKFYLFQFYTLSGIEQKLVKRLMERQNAVSCEDQNSRDIEILKQSVLQMSNDIREIKEMLSHQTK